MSTITIRLWPQLSSVYYSVVFVVMFYVAFKYYFTFSFIYLSNLFIYFTSFAVFPKFVSLDGTIWK